LERLVLIRVILRSSAPLPRVCDPTLSWILWGNLIVDIFFLSCSVILFGWIGAWDKMDEFELEDNLEFILQSIQELIEDQGDNNPFGEVNQNELLANLVNYDQVRPPPAGPLDIWLLPVALSIHLRYKTCNFSLLFCRIT
jgi:hypothetical protein